MKRSKRIFRPKRRYKIKRRNADGLKIAISAAALAALVFVGYSAAGPVRDYIRSRETQTVSEPWTPEQSSETDMSADPEDSETVPETVTQDISPVQTEPLPTVITSADTAAQVTEKVTQSETATSAPVQEQPPSETPAPLTEPVSHEVKSGGAAYLINEEDMTDIDSLNAALEEVRSSGASAVIMPMKTDGGYFYYKTNIPFALTAMDGENPFRSTVTAEQAANAAAAKGLRPVALVSVLKDNNRYGDYRDGSYRSSDDSTWLDAASDNGGKPWLSPFDETAQEYLCDIMRELGSAGFGEIICEDFIFPEFRSTDVELIGDYVAPFSSERYHALCDLAQMMTKAGGESGAKVMIRITANSIIKDYSEIFHPDLMTDCTILIDYSENNIASTMVANGEEVILSDLDEDDKVMAVFTEVERMCRDVPTEAFLDRDSMSAEEFAAAVSVINGMGYEGYYVY